MRKKLLTLTLATAMVFSLTACGGGDAKDSSKKDTSSATSDAGSEKKSDDVITIGFAQVGHESDWRTASTESCNTTFSKENGYKMSFVDCDNDSAAQLEAVRNFIQQQVDYIIIDPIVNTGWDTVLQEASDAGIPVLVIDRTIDADESLYTAWVGSDFKAEGESAGAWLQAYLEAKKRADEKINIVTIAGTTGSSAQIGRTAGFNEYVDANSNWKLLDEQDGDFTQDGGQKIMESYLKSYDDIDVVVCQNDNEAFGAMDALKTAGKSYGKDGDVIIISFDSTKAGLTETLNGNINANFECNPLAAPYVEDIIKTIEGGGSVSEKEVFMDEASFAADDTISSFKTADGTEHEITVMSKEVLDARAY